MSKTLVLKPRLSEKAYGLSETRNTYVFDVPNTANRQLIAKAIEQQFGVTVTNVHIAAIRAKTRRTYQRRGRVVHRGHTSAGSKAYITLKEGDKLPLFAAVDEASKTEKTEEKK